MFIYSFKASTLKFFGIIGVAVLTLAALVILIPSTSPKQTQEIALMNENISFKGVESANDVPKFLSQFGWQVEQAPLEECEITVPKAFDKVMNTYNELQKQQGLDLSKYHKKTAHRYTYKVTNYEGYEGTVYANVITYRGKVIAADICSADASGFMHTLLKPNFSNN